MRGKVKSYDRSKMYGFIVDGNGENFLFFKTEWKLPPKPAPGMEVEFDPIRTDRGMRAVNIDRIRRVNV